MKLRTIPFSRIKRGQRVFLRIDANVPLKHGRIVKHGTWRLEQSAQTIHALSKRGAIIVLCAHLGRPEGRRVKELSMAPIARWFARNAKVRTVLAPGIVGSSVEKYIEKAQPGDVVVLENVRFDLREKKNDALFAKQLAGLADIYINDAFGVAHRKHASLHAITRYLPSYAGPLVQKEVKLFSEKRRLPFALVVGGLKLETKVAVLERLAPEASTILTAGGVSLVLQAATDRRPLLVAGKEIDSAELKLARRIMTKFGDKIHLPIDYVVRDQQRSVVRWTDEVGPNMNVVDTGPRTSEMYAGLLHGAKTIIWNGTFGAIEQRYAQAGTIAMARAIGTEKQAKRLLGGGDTVAFLQKYKLDKNFTHISTGGGAMLVFLGGGKMPALDVLKK